MNVQEIFLQTAESCIKDYGMYITLIHKTSGEYNPATSSTEIIEDSHSVKALVEDYGERFIDGKLIQANDRKLTIASASLTIEPEIGDEVVINTVSYEVINKKTERFQDAGIIHSLQIRK